MRISKDKIARLLRETEEPTTFFIAVGLSHVIRSKIGEGFTDIANSMRNGADRAAPENAE